MKARLCKCGCGGEPPVATRNENRRGWRKGEQIPYIHGHNRRKGGVAILVDPETHCWLWQRHRNSKGYGMGHDGTKLRVAHRWYWERENGPIPDGLELDHLCRNRACVNPDHLEPVTHMENVRRGENTKLTAEKVRQIRSLCREGWLGADIAAAYEITNSNVSAIRNERTWVGV